MNYKYSPAKTHPILIRFFSIVIFRFRRGKPSSLLSVEYPQPYRIPVRSVPIHMNNTKTDERIIRQRIAANLVRYRKLNNLTQAELAEQICYSDKSISKWERADGMPDIFVLTLLADLYRITVNDFLSETEPLYQPPAADNNKQRVTVLLLSIGIAWLAATVFYTALKFFIPSFAQAWEIFIFAIPASCIISVVFCALWWGKLIRFISISLLVWSVAACVHIIVPIQNITLMYAVAAVMQVLVLLWHILLYQADKNRKR